MDDRASSERSHSAVSENGHRSPSRTKKRSYSRSRSPSHRRSRSGSSRRSYKRSKYSRSRSRSYSRSRSRSYSPRRRRAISSDHPKPNRCLGVFGLSIYTTERQIRDIFQKFGGLDKVQIIFDAKSGRSRGFCFVYYDSVEDAKRAKEQCSGMDIDGRRIRVDFSITQRAHTPTPGIYMGNPTFMRERDDRDRRWNSRRRYDDDGYGRRGSYRRSPSPYRNRRRHYDRSRSRSYSPRRY